MQIGATKLNCEEPIAEKDRESNKKQQIVISSRQLEKLSGKYN